MATQVTLKKNDAVVYPQTITDAVAYTPTDTTKSKEKLTTYLEKLAANLSTAETNISNIQFDNLKPAMTHSGSSVVALNGSTEITFAITTNDSTTTVSESGPITAVTQHNDINTTDVTTPTTKATINATSAVNTATTGAKTINATGTLTHISGATKTVSTAHSIRVVKPWYCGFIADYTALTDPATQLLNGTAANGAKVTESPAGNTVNVKASQNAYFVVAVPTEGGYKNSTVNKIISKGAMDAEQAMDTITTLTGYTLYVCTDKANANDNAYTYAIQ